MNEIITALNYKSREKFELTLKHAICRLYLAIICYVVGSVPFKLLVLSFYVILNRKINRKDNRQWEELRNYNSHLFALM